MSEKNKRKYVKKADYWNSKRSVKFRRAIAYKNMREQFKRLINELFEKGEENGKN